MYNALFTFIALFSITSSFAQDDTTIPTETVINDGSLVDFQAFLDLAMEVQAHRAERKVSIAEFQNMSQEKNTIILDTRSKEMYDAKHIKGAIHLNFADFNQFSLFELIPDTNTRILIYCNNNFIEGPTLMDQDFFASKVSIPEPIIYTIDGEEIDTSDPESVALFDPGKVVLNPLKPLGITMALNIPTYINLYGYGYKNVFELKDLIFVNSGVVEFEGTAVVN
jgi:hypothetical protein